MKRLIRYILVICLLCVTLLARASGIYADLTAEGREGEYENIRLMCVYQGEAYCLSWSGTIYRPSLDGDQVHAVQVTMAEYDPERLSAEYSRNLELDAKNNVDVELKTRRSYTMGLTHIMSDGERLFGLNQYTGILYGFKKTGTDEFACEPLLALDWKGLGHSFFEDIVTEVNGYALDGDMLYLALGRFDPEYVETIYTLDVFDLKTGKRTTTNGKVRYVTAYGEDGMVFIEGQQLHIWDFEKGETDKIALPEARRPLCGVQFDTATGIAYCVFEGDSNLYTTRDFITFEKHSPIPVAPNLPSVSMGLIPEKMIVLADLGHIMLRDLNAIAPDKALRVLGRNELYGFESTYPHISVDLTKLWREVDKAFAEHMVLGKDHYDIYQMTITGQFEQMKRKGFFYDLSAIDGISQEIDTMYPEIRKLLTDEQGRLAAYPVEMRLNCFGVSRFAAEELGLSNSDLPKTYGELVDFLNAWTENDAGIYPYKGTSDALREALLSAVDRTYQAFYAQNPEAALMQREQVAALFDQINLLGIEGKENIEREYAIGESVGDLESFTTEPDCLLTTTYSIVPGMDLRNGYEWTNGYDFLPLTLTEDIPLILPVDSLSVYVVSPYSQSIEEASTYLSFFSKKRTVIEKVPFFEGDWVEESHFYRNANRTMLGMELAELTKRLGVIEPESLKDIEAQIEDVERKLAAWETIRYAVTPEKTETYQKRLPYMALDALTTPSANTNTLFRRLLNRQIDGQAYLNGFFEVMDKVSKEQ